MLSWTFKNDELTSPSFYPSILEKDEKNSVNQKGNRFIIYKERQSFSFSDIMNEPKGPLTSGSQCDLLMVSYEGGDKESGESDISCFVWRERERNEGRKI